MFENLTTTETLAVLMALYFLAAGIGLFFERDGIPAMFRELAAQPLLGYLAGVMAFVIGGAIVAVHNDWSSILAGFVSLVGWIALAEGVLMLAARKSFLEVLERVPLTRNVVTGFGAVTLLAGVLLLFAALGG